MFFSLIHGVHNMNYRNQLQLVNVHKSVLAQEYQSKNFIVLLCIQSLQYWVYSTNYEVDF
jgi:hypothetical protein